MPANVNAVEVATHAKKLEFFTSLDTILRASSGFTNIKKQIKKINTKLATKYFLFFTELIRDPKIIDSSPIIKRASFIYFKVK